MNSRRYTMTSLSIVFLALTIMSVSAIGQNAYAAGAGMSLSADCSGSSCDVSGTTDRNDQDVTVVITASNGNIVQVDQLSVSGGSFSTTFNVSASDDGAYKIAANQGPSGKYSLNVSVDVSGGSSDSSDSSTSVVGAAAVEETAAVAAGGLTLSAGGIEGSTTIDVSGTTDRNGDITLKVTAPNGNVISVSQISPSGGSFMTTIETGGALWSQDGMYTISAHQGAATNYQTSADVEIVDGHVIPEFGVIAAMILAVAIVSIIVVTAKTKLSIVPRY
jgi:predicted secreted protein with PEFG-CTERM motif